MMKEKKNIDRLFQEKFKDFEITPDEAVWEKIKEHQAKNNKRRGLIIPLWFRIAGVAALLVLLFSLGRGLWNPDGITQPIVTDTNSSNKNTTTEESEYPKNTMQQNAVVEETSTQNSTVFPDESYTTKNKTKNIDVHTQPAQKDNNRLVNVTGKKETPNTETATKNRITSAENDTYGENPNLEKSKTNIAVVGAKKEDALQQEETTTNRVATSGENPTDTKPDQEDAIRKNELEPNTSAISEAIAEKTEEKAPENEKKSIFDAINDSKESKEDEVAVSRDNRWMVAPTVAPVYYNSLGDGSSIDAEFADNGREGQVNMSYGVQIAYAVNKKLSIRSGVNRVNLGYGTQDVGFSPSISGQSLENISYGANSQAIQVSDFNPATPVSSFIASETNADFQKFSLQNRGVLNLVLNYIEVPMEMKYALVDKKIGVHLIGGVSTLFLQDNQLSISAGDFTTNIGESRNLNDVSFSSNIGIGMDYELSEKFHIQMEPIFKYQINAYTNTSGNFNPYYFGIYTGVSYRF